MEKGERVALSEKRWGKSTLLRIIAGITEPTRGTVAFRGGLGELLDVGAGFHAELSGRDNIELVGAIMGMPRHLVRERFEQIVQFAEVTDALDLPIKHYSSGMYLRLAFAVAAHLDADLLLIDEALSVGDQDFQRRSLERLRQLAATGSTVLLVSHERDDRAALHARHRARPLPRRVRRPGGGGPDLHRLGHRSRRRRRRPLIRRTDALRRRFYAPEDHPYRVFERRIEELATNGTVVLDAGCGRDPASSALDSVSTTVGIDRAEVAPKAGVIMCTGDLSHLPLVASSRRSGRSAECVRASQIAR